MMNVMEIKVHELLKFCWDHGYKVNPIPVGNLKVRLDAVEPTRTIPGKKVFSKKPRKGDLGYQEKTIQMYLAMRKQILTSKS
jgi:hypothetical protein